MSGNVYLCRLLGFGEEQHINPASYHLLKRSWDNFDEEQIEGYPAGGYIGDRCG